MKLEQITAFCSQDSTRKYALTLPWVEDRIDLPAPEPQPWLHATDGRILIRVDAREIEDCAVEEIRSAREGIEGPPNWYMWEDFRFPAGIRESWDFPETPSREEECAKCEGLGVWACDCPVCREIHDCDACVSGRRRVFDPEAHEIRGRMFAAWLIERIRALPAARWLAGPLVPVRLAFRFGESGEGLLMPLQTEEERRGEG
ncbi:MAG TPA: hypothetical protein PLA50_00895 [Bacteroidia bacterium]|nr:hypothetical protein [Bacteroidia bacterium]